MPDTVRTATLAGETDFDGFRAAARRLLAEGLDPDHVHWAVADSAAPQLLDAAGPQPAPPAGEPVAAAAQPRVPPAFVELCRDVVLHADPGRFALLYRLLWRLQREPSLRHDTLDPDMTRARHMAHAVRRESHKMHAFVRFREVQPEGGGEPLHVAWFEPEHHIAEANAGFFIRRFANMRWAILTPEVSLHWDGATLTTGPGAVAADAPAADAGEALWLTYYQSTFNPARLKLDAMRKEMPRRYWPNLPEAALISGLAAAATQRSGEMVAREAQPTARRLPAQPIMKPAALIPIAADGSAAAQLQARRDAAMSCRECPIGALATQTVWGEGPVDARLVLVGEQPGDQEDLQGRPFVGPAGQLLQRAMAELGWERSLLYVTNAVKHFKYEPRGKRRVHKTPAQKEADACQHWMESELALIKPQAVVALGATAARQLMGRPVAVTRERGQWQTRADGLRVLVTLHPSALLRADPADREAGYAAWLADLRHADEFALAAA